MGVCCSSREEPPNKEDELTEYERSERIMLLNTISIGEFHKTLKDASKERSISIPDLSMAFKKHKFGQLLL